ncbi:MAG: EAL domain-containing protein [Spirochaetaceae bacterium]|nr:EAL domain-containing protein [Spirochaetaceae bacterium]
MQVITLIFLLIPLLSFFMKKKHYDMPNRFYALTVIFTCLQLLMEVVAFNYTLHTFAGPISSIFLSWVFLLATFYVLSLVDEGLFINRSKRVIIYVVLLVIDILAFVLLPVLMHVMRRPIFTPTWLSIFEKTMNVVCIFAAFVVMAGSIVGSILVFMRCQGKTRIAGLSFTLATILSVITIGICSFIPEAVDFSRQICGIFFTVAISVAFATVQDPGLGIDEVTGLFNKLPFSNYCRSQMLVGQKVNFLLINIEKFARVNQVYGHANADAVLQEFAVRLMRFAGRKNVFRSSDTDFVITCKDVADFDRYVSTFRASISENYEVKDANLTLVYSVCGLREFDIAEYFFSLNDFLRYAVKTAKNTERSGVCVLTEDQVSSYKRKLYYGAELQEILNEKRIAMYFQPIYCVATRRFEGAESLVRFPQKDGSMFPVGEMVMIAEENMLIVPLGDIIREKVCEFIAENKEALETVKFFDINLSPPEILEKNIVSKIESCINKYMIDPSKISMEITETAASVLDDSLKMIMDRLMRTGIEYLMDDFGSGYANFDMMAALKFKMIKIDRTMLLTAERSEQNRIVLEGMINIIHRMGAKVVVEGVETREQAMMVVKMGVDYIQGFFYSPPLKGSDFLKFIAAHNKR